MPRAVNADGATTLNECPAAALAVLDRKLERLCHIVSVNMVHELGAKA